ncbi:MAG: leucyl/phenylalanyl-tRNA--protein transferase [bacterium]
MSKPRKVDKHNPYLEPFMMLQLYSEGAFPMADENKQINWYMPKTRTIIPLDNFNIPRSLKKFIEKSDFEYKIDTCTMEIIKNCANRTETWISAELMEAYDRIRHLGFLHSVEVFRNNLLVGGLYGVSIRGAFFGESMFSLVPQASKCALVKLITHLKEKGFFLLDVQYVTLHLQMFGAIEINFEEYEKLLQNAYQKEMFFT